MVRLRVGALFAALALLLSACGGTAAPPAGSAGGGATASSGAAGSASAGPGKKGGTVVVAIPGDIKRTDPAMVDDSNSSYVAQNVMEGLVGLEPGSTAKLRPVLAESLPEVVPMASPTRSRSVRASSSTMERTWTRTR